MTCGCEAIPGDDGRFRSIISSNVPAGARLPGRSGAWLAAAAQSGHTNRSTAPRQRQVDRQTSSDRQPAAEIGRLSSGFDIGKCKMVRHLDRRLRSGPEQGNVYRRQSSRSESILCQVRGPARRISGEIPERSNTHDHRRRPISFRERRSHSGPRFRPTHRRRYGPGRLPRTRPHRTRRAEAWRSFARRARPRHADWCQPAHDPCRAAHARGDGGRSLEAWLRHIHS